MAGGGQIRCHMTRTIQVRGHVVRGSKVRGHVGRRFRKVKFGATAASGRSSRASRSAERWHYSRRRLLRLVDQRPVDLVEDLDHLVGLVGERRPIHQLDGRLQDGEGPVQSRRLPIKSIDVAAAAVLAWIAEPRQKRRHRQAAVRLLD